MDAFPAVTVEVETAYTVSQINQSIAAALEQSFPEAFWVAGELQGYDRDAGKAGTRRWGQVYFEIVEKEEGADAVKAGVKALMWGGVRTAVLEKLRDASGDLALQDGLQVKLLCRVDFYWPRASLQLKVMDVDPAFTLGGMERARRELIEKLKSSGLLEKNRSRPLPQAPLRVGLITSEGSAAFHDFVQELRASGYSFQIRLADARMQGAETEKDVCRALARMGADPELDVVVLARGGGSRTDLIWFDREKIARAVAECPKPVVTGIGHEIDLSVADLAAHTHCKTPTAAAQFLASAVRDFEMKVLEAGRAVMSEVRDKLERANRDLSGAARDWRHRAQVLLSGLREELAGKKEQLTGDVRRHLSLARERLRDIPARLFKASLDRLALGRERLAVFGRECALKDPVRILARGYSLLYAGGRPAKSINDVNAGEFIEARLRDGFLTASVLNKRKALLKEKP